MRVVHQNPSIKDLVQIPSPSQSTAKRNYHSDGFDSVFLHPPNAKRLPCTTFAKYSGFPLDINPVNTDLLVKHMRVNNFREMINGQAWSIELREILRVFA